jgi:hypothetical protein
MKRMYRGKFGSSPTRDIWMNANNSIAYITAYPNIFETMLRDSLRVVQIQNRNMIVSSVFDQFLRTSESSAHKDLRFLVGTGIPEISSLPFLRDLIPVLLLQLSKEESFAVLTQLMDRARKDVKRPYLSFSTSVVDWSLYQLRRYIRKPTAEQLETFMTFLLNGGSSKLSFSQFKRIVGCFLYEGCKVFVRLGIAYLLLSDDSRSDDDLLFRKAFKLRISWTTYPLSERKRSKISPFPVSHLLPDLKHEIYLPMGSELTRDLKHLIEASLEYLSIPLMRISGRTMNRVHSSVSEGTSRSIFVSKFSECISSSFLVVLLIKSNFGIFQVSFTSSLGVILRSSEPVCLFSDPVMSTSDHSSILLDAAKEVVWLIDSEMKRMTLRCVGEIDLINYELFQFV